MDDEFIVRVFNFGIVGTLSLHETPNPSLEVWLSPVLEMHSSSLRDESPVKRRLAAAQPELG